MPLTKQAPVKLRIFGCHYRGSQNPQALQRGIFDTTETRGSKQRK